MKFRFTPKLRRPRRGSEERTFTIDRLWIDEDGRATEVTGLFDRSYGYYSSRELAWHIADRFEVPPKTIHLARV